MGLYDQFTLKELQERQRALADAIAQGASRVRYRDRDVQYRDLDEMNQVADQLDQAIAAQQGERRTVAVVPLTRKAF